jgi:hypothetical protein
MTAPNEVDQDAAARAAQLDPDAQLDLLDRELGRRRAQRAADAKRADAHGGPCRFCGCVLSFAQPEVGGWHHDAHGPARARGHPGAGVGWPRRQPRGALVAGRLPGRRVPLVA